MTDTLQTDNPFFDRKEWHKQYRAKNKNRIDAYEQRWRDNNKQKILLQSKRWSERNKEKKREMYKVWRRENKEHVNAKRRKRHAEKMQSDPLYRSKHALRAVVATAIKRMGANKRFDTEHLLGGTFDVVKEHIESLFLEGMSWNNHGDWHIDHIRPVALFTEADLIKMNHYTNLQPLWAEDNYKKGDKY